MDVLTPAAVRCLIAAETSLAHVDHEIFLAIENEKTAGSTRTSELIASENYASKAVREAMGLVLTARAYAEGCPGEALLRRL